MSACYGQPEFFGSSTSSESGLCRRKWPWLDAFDGWSYGAFVLESCFLLALSWANGGLSLLQEKFEVNTHLVNFLLWTILSHARGQALILFCFYAMNFYHFCDSVTSA